MIISVNKQINTLWAKLPFLHVSCVVCTYMHLVIKVFLLCPLGSGIYVHGSLKSLSERSAVDRQSRGQFLALSPRFVCGIPGMHRNVGSDRWRGPPHKQTHSDTTAPPTHPPTVNLLFLPLLVRPSPLHLSPSVCIWKINVSKLLSCFLPAQSGTKM